MKGLFLVILITSINNYSPNFLSSGSFAIIIYKIGFIINFKSHFYKWSLCFIIISIIPTLNYVFPFSRKDEAILITFSAFTASQN